MSALCFGGVPARALAAMDDEILVASPALVAEWRQVVARPKFDERMARSSRVRLMEAVIDRCLLVPDVRVEAEVRDANDSHVLATALAGAADLIVTGDLDLLVLNPWGGIAILQPSEYLNLRGRSPASKPDP